MSREDFALAEIVVLWQQQQADLIDQKLCFFKVKWFLQLLRH